VVACRSLSWYCCWWWKYEVVNSEQYYQILHNFTNNFRGNLSPFTLTPHRGAAPGPRWGQAPRPPRVPPPFQIPVYATVSNTYPVPLNVPDTSTRTICVSYGPWNQGRNETSKTEEAPSNRAPQARVEAPRWELFSSQNSDFWCILGCYFYSSADRFVRRSCWLMIDHYTTFPSGRKNEEAVSSYTALETCTFHCKTSIQFTRFLIIYGGLIQSYVCMYSYRLVHMCMLVGKYGKRHFDSHKCQFIDAIIRSMAPVT